MWPGNPDRPQLIQRNDYFLCTKRSLKPSHPGIGLKEQNRIGITLQRNDLLSNMVAGTPFGELKCSQPK